MLLKEYLRKNKISIGDFAKCLDIHRTHLSAVVNGRKMPSIKLSKQIEYETKGNVTYFDLYNFFNGIQQIKEAERAKEVITLPWQKKE